MIVQGLSSINKVLWCEEYEQIQSFFENMSKPFSFKQFDSNKPQTFYPSIYNS